MHEKYIIAGQIYDNLPYTLQLYIIFSFENGSFESWIIAYPKKRGLFVLATRKWAIK